MSCANHVISAPTAARLENLRKLVLALQANQLSRTDIGNMLQVSQSCARAYIKELGDNVVVVRHIGRTEAARSVGDPVYRLAIAADQVGEFLAGLAATMPRRHGGRAPEIVIAARDPRRHFHILADDTHYAIRVSRTPAMRDPLVAAFFGAAAAASVQSRAVGRA